MTQQFIQAQLKLLVNWFISWSAEIKQSTLLKLVDELHLNSNSKILLLHECIHIWDKAEEYRAASILKYWYWLHENSYQLDTRGSLVQPAVFTQPMHGSLRGACNTRTRAVQRSQWTDRRAGWRLSWFFWPEVHFWNSLISVPVCYVATVLFDRRLKNQLASPSAGSAQMSYYWTWLNTDFEILTLTVQSRGHAVSKIQASNVVICLLTQKWEKSVSNVTENLWLKYSMFL